MKFGKPTACVTGASVLLLSACSGPPMSSFAAEKARRRAMLPAALFVCEELPDTPACEHDIRCTAPDAIGNSLSLTGTDKDLTVRLHAVRTEEDRTYSDVFVTVLRSYGFADDDIGAAARNNIGGTSTNGRWSATDRQCPAAMACRRTTSTPAFFNETPSSYPTI